MNFNVDVSLECSTEEAAREVAGLMYYYGFIPEISGAVVRVIAKDIGQRTFEFLAAEIEGNELINDRFFHINGKNTK